MKKLEKEYNLFKYKECNCEKDAWEEIVVQQDDHFGGKTVIYFHCSDCGNDFRVEDFYTHEELHPKIIE
ncbi:MAG: hypothetical protein H6552_05365 [Chitinophagales bacterium]|nr:hypothetical protein [Bacteroidota bacterium]MCB9074948.1 hypothetical protein [Chitinophagales bacterium]